MMRFGTINDNSSLLTQAGFEKVSLTFVMNSIVNADSALVIPLPSKIICDIIRKLYEYKCMIISD